MGKTVREKAREALVPVDYAEAQTALSKHDQYERALEAIGITFEEEQAARAVLRKTMAVKERVFGPQQKREDAREEVARWLMTPPEMHALYAEVDPKYPRTQKELEELYGLSTGYVTKLKRDPRFREQFMYNGEALNVLDTGAIEVLAALREDAKQPGAPAATRKLYFEAWGMFVQNKFADGGSERRGLSPMTADEMAKHWTVQLVQDNSVNTFIVNKGITKEEMEEAVYKAMRRLMHGQGGKDREDDRNQMMLDEGDSAGGPRLPVASNAVNATANAEIGVGPVPVPKAQLERERAQDATFEDL